LIYTVISNKTGLFESYQHTPQVLAARSFLVAGFDTCWVSNFSRWDNKSFTGNFPQKSPVLGGSFAERDPQLAASYERVSNAIST